MSKQNGFSTTELIVAAAITGSLAAIGTPVYINQIKSNCQRQAETYVSQLITQYQSYNDEFGQSAKGWSDLGKVGVIMTSAGPAEATDFSKITVGTCNYETSATQEGYTFNILSTPSAEIDSEPVDPSQPGTDAGLNVAGCINTATGASEIKRGDGKKDITISDLNCS